MAKIKNNSIDFDIVKKTNTDLLDLQTITTQAKHYLESQITRQPLSLELIFTTPEELAFLNSKYRHKDKTTDVLSFPLWEHKKDILKAQGLVHLGTIFINVSQIALQAKAHGLSVSKECSDLILHSIDHLLGKHHPE